MNASARSVRALRPGPFSVALVVGAVSSVAQGQVGFYVVPPVEPGNYTLPWGVSPDGGTVVGQGGTSSNVRAFTSTAGTTLNLGLLPGGTYSVAQAISSNGVVVGWGSSPQGTVAWRYANGVMTSIGDLPGGSVSSNAWAVSANGNVIVGRSASAAGSEAFRWEGGVMVGLGDLPGGSSHDSEALGVSADGSIVVGYGHISSSHRRAFRWEGGVMTDIGSLSGPLGDSHARAITPDGSIIVGGTHSPIGNQAFLWENGVMTGLGHFGNRWTMATAVSADGSVVAARTADGGPGIALVWDEMHGMRSVAEVLAGLGFSTGGLILRESTGISADGLTIVGRGESPSGQEQAWIAVIPAPSTVVLLLAAPLAATRRRRFR